MFNVSKRYLKRLAPVALALVLIGVLAPASAEAATYTNVSVTPTDPSVSAATTWTFNLSNATAATVKCLAINFDTAAAFTGTSSAVVPTGNPVSSSLFTAGSWTSGPTAIGSSSQYQWQSTSGITAAAGASKTFSISVTNPAAAGSVYVKVQTFTDACTTVNDSGISSATVTANTTVSVIVDPTFTFAVNSQAASTVCNGLTSGVATTSGTVPFGHVAASARAFAVQQLNVITNAGNGYVVYLHSTATSAGVMKGNNSHVVPDSGTVAIPAAGTAFFGYTTDSTTAAVTSGNIKSVPQSTGNDVVGNGAATASSNNCVGFGIGASSTTPADTYTATMVYTAVPTF